METTQCATDTVHTENKEKYLVAAVDFGTTYSGYAFSFRHEYNIDPTKISANQWTAGTLLSLKTPSCVLIRPDGTFDSFGYEAENKYSELLEKVDEGVYIYRKWIYFKRFKMMLFEKMGLNREITLEDEQGNTMKAKTVFAMVIKYLREHLLKASQTRLTGIEPDDIHWVLTVPAIWNDAAKQFMRESAVQAGISNNHLTIALEPEAASLYCRHLPVSRMAGADKTSLASLEHGSTYMVLDCGGGTVDVTVHQIMDEGSIKEIHSASGGAWGGTQVDEAFKQLLIEIVGKDPMDEFRIKYTMDYLDFFRDFEIKKRDISPQAKGMVVFRFPMSLREVFEENTQEDLKEAVARTSLAGKVLFIRDKIKIDADIIKNLFRDTTEQIVQHVKDLLHSPSVCGISAILMVGGFSESAMLQDAICRNFPDIIVIIPEEAGLAVVKGAVIFGHNPTTVAQRVCTHTYGFKTITQFDPTIHPDSKKIICGGRETCTDIFSKYVEIGQTVRLGEAMEEMVYSVYAEKQTVMKLPLYVSTQRSPEFVTDPGCERLGNILVSLQDTTGGLDRQVAVQMVFVGTELSVVAKELATGNLTKGTFDFLG